MGKHTIKQQFGQFYTTNASYIVRNQINKILNKEEEIIDPFAGNNDLLCLISENKKGFDIFPKSSEIEKRDTLLNPPNYKNKWILTNPPYLARNKSKDKKIFNVYQVGDLYKAALKSFESCKGGVVIVPVNLFSDEDVNFRKYFFNLYEINDCDVFEEQVFDDTTYTVCCFFFERKNFTGERKIKFNFYPKGKEETFIFSEDNNFRIGNEFIDYCKKEKSKIKVSRLLKGQQSNSNIFLRAIDTGTEKGKISLSLRNEPFYGKNTDRAFASLNFSKTISFDIQKEIVKRFNEKMSLFREKYNSMFLTNFRNATAAYSRKRISFREVYSFIRVILAEIEKENLIISLD